MPIVTGAVPIAGVSGTSPGSARRRSTLVDGRTGADTPPLARIPAASLVMRRSAARQIARPGVHLDGNGRPSTLSVVRIAGSSRRAVHGAKEQCGGALHPAQSSVRVGTLPADGPQPRLPADESVQDRR